MSDESSGFPHRDADGRIDVLSHLLGVALAGLVVGLLTLVLFDWAFNLMGSVSFGRANGWLALILPAWLYLDDFRAWEFGVARVVAALFAGVLGVVGGLLAAGLFVGSPPLVSGAAAATVCTVFYGLLWFPSVRWLARRTG